MNSPPAHVNSPPPHVSFAPPEVTSPPVYVSFPLLEFPFYLRVHVPNRIVGTTPVKKITSQSVEKDVLAHKSAAIVCDFSTPEKKRIRLTQKNSADMSDIGFLNVPAED